MSLVTRDSEVVTACAVADTGCKVLVARSSLLREDWGQSLGRGGGERDLRLRGYLFHFLHAAVYDPRIGRGRHFHALVFLAMTSMKPLISPTPNI